MKTLQETAITAGYELRHFLTPLKVAEDMSKVVKVFDFSVSQGGIVDAHVYYNDFYLYPIISNKQAE